MMSDRSSSTSSLRTEAPKGALVRPQPVTESSLLDSVAGFINEVQALNKPNHDSKLQVTWASFLRADINDPALFPELAEINGNYPPLMLALGYTQGVQIWLIPMTGEAQEVLAWRQGQVKTLKILPSPDNCLSTPDNFAHCRPLVVMVDSTGFTSASFISLKSGESVHNIKFNSEVADVLANKRVVILSFREKLAAFDAANLEPRFTVTTCYPSPGLQVNPIALGDRWLAYADQQFVPIHRSLGGMIVDGGQSVTAWGINVGSRLAQGVSKLYSNIFSAPKTASGASSCHPCSMPPMPASSSGNVGSIGSTANEMQKGIVTILDVLQVGNNSDQDEVNLTDKLAGVVAHFVAHNKAVVALEFDTNGTLLLTADSVGNYFNLFKIMANPSGSCYSTVHHLYSLYRGETPGSVQDIAFSPDSRWVAVSTLRGTSHIFPITPYGGPIGVRTHTSTRVVNRLSRFHRSAGLDEHYPTTATANQTSSGRSSPNPSLGSSPVISKMYVDPTQTGTCPLVIPYPNPYVPPFPAPTITQPLAQLRQPYIVTLATNAKSSTTKKQSEELVPIRLAVAFAPSRAAAKQSGNIFHRQSKAKMVESLYVMANHGVLLEYSCEALPEVNSKDNICESSPIKLQVEAFGQWNLVPPKATNELQPPLSNGNPLMDTILFNENEKKLTHNRHPSGGGGSGGAGEDRWLSQVEIVTHVGPHRRLWMGPQFSFKTLRPAKDGKDSVVTQDLDISCKPEQSHPVNMPSAPGCLQHNVLIECGSASSFELSPNHPFRSQITGSTAAQDHHHDVENEIHDAMTDTVLQNENESLDGLLKHHQHLSNSINKRKGGSASAKFGESSSAEEEFFCLTPEDARSISSNTGSDRSRNASATSHQVIPDTKIFSVAVETMKEPVSGGHSGVDSMVVCDVDTDYTGRFAVVSSEKQTSTIIKKQLSRHRENKIEADEAVEQVVKVMKSQDSCEKLLAEALETTVLEDKVHAAQDLLKIQSPPNLLEDDEEEFKEMHRKPDEEFCEMQSTKEDEDREDNDEEEEVFKIKEEIEEGTSKVDLMEVDDDDDDHHHHPKTALDLLGNDIVKSIEKANLLYEGQSQDQGSPAVTLMFKNNESSEDDLEFKPVTSGKKKKKNKNKSNNSNDGGSSTSSCIDSSAEESACDTKTSTNEGWSFEADDLDVNKLLAEVVSQQPPQQQPPEPQEEKAALEDVFKFDSELNSESKNKKIIDMSSSLNYEDDSKEDTKMSQSLTYGGCSATTTSNSESSVGNSPNPRAASKKKGKSKKKKR